jgi:hypothetical protein
VLRLLLRLVPVLASRVEESILLGYCTHLHPVSIGTSMAMIVRDPAAALHRKNAPTTRADYLNTLSFLTSMLTAR